MGLEGQRQQVAQFAPANYCGKCATHAASGSACAPSTVYCPHQTSPSGAGCLRTQPQLGYSDTPATESTATAGLCSYDKAFRASTAASCGRKSGTATLQVSTALHRFHLAILHFRHYLSRSRRDKTMSHHCWSDGTMDLLPWLARSGCICIGAEYWPELPVHCSNKLRLYLCITHQPLLQLVHLAGQRIRHISLLKAVIVWHYLCTCGQC